MDEEGANLAEIEMIRNQSGAVDDLLDDYGEDGEENINNVNSIVKSVADDVNQIDPSPRHNKDNNPKSDNASPTKQQTQQNDEQVTATEKDNKNINLNENNQINIKNDNQSGALIDERRHSQQSQHSQHSGDSTKRKSLGLQDFGGFESFYPLPIDETKEQQTLRLAQEAEQNRQHLLRKVNSAAPIGLCVFYVCLWMCFVYVFEKRFVFVMFLVR